MERARSDFGAARADLELAHEAQQALFGADQQLESCRAKLMADLQWAEADRVWMQGKCDRPGTELREGLDACAQVLERAREALEMCRGVEAATAEHDGAGQQQETAKEGGGRRRRRRRRQRRSRMPTKSSNSRRRFAAEGAGAPRGAAGRSRAAAPAALARAAAQAVAAVVPAGAAWAVPMAARAAVTRAAAAAAARGGRGGGEASDAPERRLGLLDQSEARGPRSSHACMLSCCVNYVHESSGSE